MEFKRDKLFLYEIDIDYIKYLYKFDKSVYYNEASKTYKDKPYAGIIISQSNNNYFIPLTSAKEKHKDYKNATDNNFLIYEKLSMKEMLSEDTTNWVYKSISENEVPTIKHILAVLDIKKMIPVPEQCFSKIDIVNMKDTGRKKLLEKEHSFLKGIREKVSENANKIYSYQMKTGKVFSQYCNFALLEEKCKEYEKMLNEKDKPADKDVDIKNSNKDANKDKSVDNNSDKEDNISSNNEEKNNENNSKSPLPENKASKEELEDKQFFDTANMINNTYGNIKTVAEKANIALNNIKNNPSEHTENHKGNNITNNLSNSEDDKYDEPT